LFNLNIVVGVANTSTLLLGQQYVFIRHIQRETNRIRLLEICTTSDDKVNYIHRMRSFGYGAQYHFQQYFSYIVAVSFIG